MAEDKAVKKDVKPKTEKVADAKPKAAKPSVKKEAGAEAGVFGATRKYEDKAKIKILIKENPHREGSNRAAAFDAVKGCKTMGDYYATEQKTKYIQAWIDSGHIEVA